MLSVNENKLRSIRQKAAIINATQKPRNPGTNKVSIDIFGRTISENERCRIVFGHFLNFGYLKNISTGKWKLIDVSKSSIDKLTYKRFIEEQAI